MTLDEYAQEVAGQLRNAHNTKNLSAVAPIFRKADAVLADNKIAETDRRDFWTTVRTSFQESQLLFERQANSALIALMQAIQKELAARGNP
jgi:hypothetical protein